MAQLSNTMEVTARYNDVDTTARSTVILEMGNMTLIKSANQDPWIDGDLTYTVTLENIETTGDISSIVFSDMIDITKSRLLTDTVTLNGTILEPGTGFTYDPATGELEITYDVPLPPGATVTITFQVRKV